jgi:hypothetical protein
MGPSEIDIVLPYVDSSVREWQDTFLAAKHKKFVTSRARNLFLQLFSNRYASYGMFRYWWRGYEKYGPPGKVHLLLQAPSQVPPWLDTHNPRIVIHYHDEFMPKDILPSYNSSCIELCFLYRHAKDLTPFFLMMNDDFYFNAPCTFDDFVEGDHPLTWKEVRSGKYKPTCLFRSIVYNDLELVSKMAGTPCPHYTHNHLAVCYKRETAVDFLGKAWPTISRTMTQFRDARNYNHWIIRYWQDHTGIAEHSPRFPHRGYLEMPDASRESIAALANAKVVCFNDTNGRFSPAVKAYLEQHYPGRCTFELE